MFHHEAFTTDRVAVITGAADGIGLAAARRCASFGMHVLMADIDLARLETAALAIAACPGQRIETQVTDVAHLAESAALSNNVTLLTTVFGADRCKSPLD